MITTNKLDFYSRHWDSPHNDMGWQEFKVGTCRGQWRCVENSYQILSIINDSPGNGHLNDVFEWFEASCKRDAKALIILEVLNKKFSKHLISKRGFTYADGDNLIKRFQ